MVPDLIKLTKWIPCVLEDRIWRYACRMGALRCTTHAKMAKERFLIGWSIMGLTQIARTRWRVHVYVLPGCWHFCRLGKPPFTLHASLAWCLRRSCCCHMGRPLTKLTRFDLVVDSTLLVVASRNSSNGCGWNDDEFLVFYAGWLLSVANGLQEWKGGIGGVFDPQRGWSYTSWQGGYFDGSVGCIFPFAWFN